MPKTSPSGKNDPEINALEMLGFAGFAQAVLE